MKNKKAQQTAWMGMLFALCLVLSYLEGTVTPLLGLAPGIKLGIANLAVMYALLFMDKKQAFLLVVLKALFGLITRGVIAGMVSFSGGMLSLLVMVLLIYCFRPTVFVFSASGAVFHNVGQLIAASILLQNRFVFGYAPVLLVAGLVVGGVNGILLRAVVPAMQHIGNK